MPATRPKPARPCGPQDRRLRMSRCAGCRRARTGCDGNRPCGKCKARNIPCVEPTPAVPNDLVFMPSNPGAPSPRSQAERKRSLNVPPEDLEAFLTAIGDNPSPFLSAFDRHFMTTEMDKCPAVRSAVLAIGRVKRRALAGGSRSSGPLNEDDLRERVRLREQFNELLPTGDAPITQTAQLTGVLLCIYELMIDVTGLGFISTVEHLSNRMASQYSAGHLRSYGNKHLVAVNELITIVKAAVMDEDTFLGDHVSTYSLGQSLSGCSLSSDPDLNLLQTFCTFMASFARTNSRSVQWMSQARSLCGHGAESPGGEWWRNTLEAHGLLVSGREVVAEGKRSLRILDGVRQWRGGTTAPTPDSFASLREALYNIGLISIARVFTDPLWTYVESIPPATEYMPNLTALGSAALEPLEMRLPYYQLESLVVMPSLFVAALEVKSADDKERILRMLGEFSEKGFVVAETYMEDIKLAWKFGDELASSRKAFLNREDLVADFQNKSTGSENFRDRRG